MEVKFNPGRVCLQAGLWVMVCGCVPAGPSQTRGPSFSQHSSSGQQQPGLHTPAAKNDIIFLSMTMSQDQAGTRRVLQLSNLIKKPGTLKSRGPEAPPAGPYLLGTLHAGSRVLDTLYLDHPLFKNPEIINAQNQLVRQPVTLQQAAFFIRFQQQGADLLILSEKLPASPGQELMRIKL